MTSIFNHNFLLRQIMPLFQKLARGVLLFAIVGLLYSCGGGGGGGAADNAGDGAGAGGGGGGTPPSDEVIIEQPEFENGRFTFASESYSVEPDATIDIEVVLSKPAAGDTTIILEEFINDIPGARPRVSMAAGATTVTYTYDASGRANGDAVRYEIGQTDEAGEYGRGNPRVTYITVDANRLSFVDDNYSVVAGNSVDIEVSLSFSALNPITVPIIVFENVSGLPVRTRVENAEFLAGSDRAVISYTPPSSAGDGYVSYSFETPLPGNLAIGDTPGTVVNVTADTTTPGIRANFGAAEYVIYSGSATAEVNLASNLPLRQEILVNVEYRPLIVPAGGTWLAYPQPIRFSVDSTGQTAPSAFINYVSGQGDREYRFADTISATSGVDIVAGTPNTTVVKVVSGGIAFVKDVEAINVGGVANVEIALAVSAARDFDITIIPEEFTAGGTSVARRTSIVVPFRLGESLKSFSFDTAGETPGNYFEFTFETPLPAGIVATTGAGKHTLQLRADSVKFTGQSTYNDVEPGDFVDIPLESTIGTAVNIPLIITVAGNPDETDRINFAGGTTGTYRLDTSQFSGGDVVKVKLGNVNGIGLAKGTPDEVTINIVHSNTINFSTNAASVNVGSSVDFDVEFAKVYSTSADVNVKIIETVNGTSTEQVATVLAGDTSVTLAYNASLATAGTQVEYRFSVADLPVGVGLGSPDTLIITVGDSNINFAKATDTVRSGGDVAVRVVLGAPETTAMVVPIVIKTTPSGGATVTDSSKTITIPANSLEWVYVYDTAVTNVAEGTEIEFSFGSSLPNGLTVDTSGTPTSTITVASSAINFVAATYDVRQGTDVVITVELETPATGALPIPYTINGATNPSFVLDFATGEQSKTINYFSSATDTAGATITFGFGTLPVGVTEGSIDEAVLTIQDSSIQFDADAYSVAVDGNVGVLVKLASPAIGLTTIPINVDGVAGTPIVFADGATEATITYDASGIVSGTRVTYTFGTLPTGVTAGGVISSVVIVGNVFVGFDKVSYDIFEGNAGTVRINITGTRSVDTVVNVTVTETAADGTVGAPTATPLTFGSLDTHRTIAISTTAAGDAGKKFTYTIDASTLATGVAVEVNKGTSEVNIRGFEVSFEDANISIRQGGTAKVKVKLDSAAIGDIYVPIRINEGGTFVSNVPPVHFSDGDTEVELDYDTTSKAAGALVVYTFDTGNLPAGVSAHATENETIILILDSSIDFDSATYDVRVGATVDITVDLASRDTTRTITVPYTVNGASDASYVLVFAPGDTDKTITHDASSNSGGDAITYAFADTNSAWPSLVTAGSDAVVDVVDGGIEFDSATYDVGVSGTVTVKIVLASPAIGNTVIPLDISTTPSGGTAVSSTDSVTIPDGADEVTFDYTAPATSSGTEIVYSFGTLPAGAIAGTIDETTITVLESAINFDEATYSVRGGETVAVKVVLGNSTAVNLTIPFKVTQVAKNGNAGTIYPIVTILAGASEGTVNHTTIANDATVTYEFDTDNTENATADWPVGLNLGTVDESIITVTDSSIDFDEATYNVRSGATVAVKVVLASPANGSTVIPLSFITTTLSGGASLPDTSRDVTILDGAIEATFNYVSPANSQNITVVYSFGTLPTGVSAGTTTPTSTVTVQNAAIDFDATTYNVRESATVAVKLNLGSPAIGDLPVPLKVTTTATDNTAVITSETVTIPDGDSSLAFDYTAGADAAGVRVGYELDDTVTNWPVGLSEGTTAHITTVTVQDSAINFEKATDNVRAGDAVTVKVILASPAIGSTVIPFTVTTNPAGALAVPNTVTIPNGATEATFDYAPPATSVANTVVRYTFGTLPAGVSPGTTQLQTEITIQDSSINFAKADYPVREGATVTVQLNLGSPAIGALVVPLKVTTTPSSGTAVETYTTVTVADGNSNATFDYTAGASADGVTVKYEFDAVDTDDTTVNWPAGLTVGTTTPDATVTVEDSVIDFVKATDNVRSGATVEVKVVLASPAIGRTVIPLSILTSGTSTPDTSKQIVIDDGDTTGKIDYVSPTNSQNITVVYSFGTLPTGVSAGTTTPTSTITVQNAAIDFDAATYNVREGATLAVQLNLASPAIGDIAVPLRIITTATDNTALTTFKTVTIPDGDSSATFDYTAPDNYAGYTVKYEFADDLTSSWPVGLSEGTTVPISTVTVQEREIYFDEVAYNVRAGDTVTVKVVLASPAIGDTLIPFTVTIGAVGAPIVPNSVTIPNGATEATFDYVAPATSAGARIRYTFGTLPAGVWYGATKRESVISVLDSSINFAEADYPVREGATVTVQLNLGSPAVGALVVPLKVTTTPSSGTAVETYTTVTVADGNSNATFDYTAGASADGVTVKYEFDAVDTDDTTVNWPAGLTVGTTTPDATVTVTDSAIKFDVATYNVRAGATVTVKIVLTSPAIGNTLIPLAISTTPSGGTVASSTDSVTISGGASEITFDYTAPANGKDTTVTYAFGTLPAGVVAGTAPSTSTVTVTDSAIDFDVATYNVREGATVAVQINLGSPAIGELVVPLKVTTTATDSTEVVTYKTITIANNASSGTLNYVSGTSDPGTTDVGVTVKYEFDTVDADDTTANWPVGLSPGTTVTASTVTVTDSAINFDKAGYAIRAGGTVTVKVVLVSPAIGDTVIPFNVVTNPAGAPIVPNTVTIPNGATEATFVYAAPAAANIGTVVNYTFGTLPVGVSGGSVPESNITIQESTIDFDETTYNVREGLTVSVQVNLLSASVGALVVPLKVTTTPSGGTAVETYTTVTIADGSSSATFDYTAGASDAGVTVKYEFDSDDSDDTTVNWPVGLNVGTTTPISTVTVTASAVDFDVATYSVRAGATVVVKVVLAGPASGNTVIPLNISTTPSGGTAVSTTGSVTIADGASEITFDYTAPASSKDTTVVYTFGALPAGVTSGTVTTSTVTVEDSAINFDAAAYNVREGATVTVKVILASPAIGNAVIPLAISTTPSGGTAVSSTDSVTILDGASEITFDYTAPASSKDTTVAYTFGTLPVEVSLGTVTTSTVTVTDSAIDFDRAEYPVRAGDTVTAKVVLASPAIGINGADTVIPFNVVSNPAGALTTPNSVSIPNGATEATFDYAAPATATIGTRVLYTFGTLPAGVSPGTTQLQSEIAIQDSSINFDVVAYDVREDRIVTLQVNLISAAVGSLVVPLKLTTTTNGTDVVTYETVTIADTANNGTFTYDASGIADGVTVKYEFDDTDADDTTVNWPVGLNAGTAVAETIVTVQDSSIDFDAATYPVRAGDTVAVKVVLAYKAVGDTVIPFTVTTNPTGGTVTPATVTILDGATEAEFNYVAPADGSGTTVTYAFGTLPTGVSVGTTEPDSDIAIQDSSIDFDEATYSVRAGGTIAVKVVLASQVVSAITVPLKVTRTPTSGAPVVTYTTIDITAGASDATLDYAADSSYAGVTVKYEFDSLDTDDITVNWPAGLSVGTTEPVSTITIHDSSIDFDVATYSVRAGGTVAVKVVLAYKAVGDTVIPFTVTTNPTGGTVTPATVTILDGATEAEFNYVAPADGSGTTVTYAFGALPTGVSLGTTTDASAITIQDSGINFDAATYDVRENTTVTLKVNLVSAAVGELIVPLKLTTTTNGTDVVTYETVTIADTANSGTFDYTAGASDAGIGVKYEFDTVDADDTSATAVNWPAGLEVGSLDEAIVTILDSAVDFELAAYPVRAGATVTVKVVLTNDAVGETVIPFNISTTPSGGTATLTTGSVTIPDGGREITFDYTSLANGKDTEVVYTFGTLPAGVSAGATTDETKVTVEDSAIDFDAATYAVRANAPVTIKLNLASPAIGDTDIPLNISITPTGGVATQSTRTVTIPDGASEVTFDYTAPATAGEAVYTFGTLPDGVSAGTTDTSTITIQDSAINFATDAYSVGAGDTVAVKVVLATPVPATGTLLEVPLKVTTYDANDVVTTTDYTKVDIALGASEGIISYDATGVAPGVKVEYEFDVDNTIDASNGDWPAGLSEGTVDKATVTVQDSEIDFAEGTYNVRAGGTVTLEVNLASAAIGDIIVPLKATTTATDGTVTTSYITATVSNGDSNITFDYTAAASDTGFTIKYEFDTVDADDATADWPVALSVGTTAPDSTVTVQNSGIDFDVATYDVREGGTVDVKVNLVTPSIGTIEVPLKVTTTGTGGTDTISYTSVTFADTETTKTATYTAPSSSLGVIVKYEFDTDDTDDATLDWPDDVVEGTGILSNIITIKDASVTIAPATKIVDLGNTQDVTVTLATPAIGETIIPIVRTDTKLDGTVTTSTQDVTFADGEDEKVFAFDSTANVPGTTNKTAPGSTVKYTFGTLPASITLGTDVSSTLSLNQTQVEFAEALYEILEGETSVQIEVNLSAVARAVYNVPIVSNGSTQVVTFAIGEQSKLVTINTSSLTAGYVGSYRFGSLSDELIATGTILTSIKVTGLPKVSFASDSTEIIDVADPVSITVNLSTPVPYDSVVQLIRKITNLDGTVDTNTLNVAFDAGEQTKTVLDSLPDFVYGETATYSFGTLPTDWQQDATNVFTVTVAPNVTRAVSFAKPNHSDVPQPGRQVTFKINLNHAADKSYVIPLVVTRTVISGNSNAVTVDTSKSVTFNVGDTSKGYTYTHSGYDGKAVVVEFGTLPNTIVAGTYASSFLDITEITARFGESAGQITDGDDIGFTLLLGRASETDVTIRVLYKADVNSANANALNTVQFYDIASSTNLSENIDVIIPAGETEKTVIHKTYDATLKQSYPANSLFGFHINNSFVNPLPIGYTGTYSGKIMTLKAASGNFIQISELDKTIAKGETVDFDLEISNPIANAYKVTVERTTAPNGGTASTSNTDYIIPANATTQTISYDSSTLNTDDGADITYTIQSVELCLTSNCSTSVSSPSLKIGTNKSIKITVAGDEIISFKETNLTIDKGDTATVTVQRAAAAANALIIPVVKKIYNASGDLVDLENSNVTIASNNTEGTVSFDSTSIANHNYVIYEFGTLPNGSRVGTNTQTRVDITYDYITFDRASIEQVIGVLYTLQPSIMMRRVTSPGIVGAVTVVWSIRGGVFPANFEQSVVLSPNQGRRVLLGTVNTPGQYQLRLLRTTSPSVALRDITESVINVVSNSSATFNETASTVLKDETATINLTRMGNKTVALDYPISIETTVPGNVATTTSGTVNFVANNEIGTITLDTSTLAADSTVKYSFDTSHADWPSGHVVGANANHIVTVMANNQLAVPVQFANSAVNIDQVSGNIQLKLAEAPTSLLSVPVTIIYEDVSAGTTNTINHLAGFVIGAVSANVPYDARSYDTDDTVKYSFGTLPAGYIAGTNATSTLTVRAATSYVAEFDGSSASDVFANTTIPVKVKLDKDATSSFGMVVKIKRTHDGTLTETRKTVTFNVGDREQTISYNTDDDGNGADTALEFSLETYPSTITEGTQNIYTATVKDSAVSFVGDSSFTEYVDIGSSGGKNFTLRLNNSRTSTLTVPLQVTEAASDGTVTVRTENFVFNAGETSKIVDTGILTVTKAGSEIIYRLGDAAGVSPSTRTAFDYKFIISNNVVTFDLASQSKSTGATYTVGVTLGEAPIITTSFPYRILQQNTATSTPFFESGGLSIPSGNILVAAGATQGNIVLTLHGDIVNGGSAIFSFILTGTDISGYLLSGTTAHRVNVLNNTVEFSDAISVADVGDDVAYSWTSSPAYLPANHGGQKLQLKTTYLDLNGNALSTFTADIDDYDASGTNSGTLTVPTVIPGGEVILELVNLPSNIGLGDVSKQRVVVSRDVFFSQTAAYTGVIGTNLTETLKLQASNNLPYDVEVPVIAMLQEGGVTQSTENITVLIKKDTKEATFDYNVPASMTGAVRFELPADLGDAVVKRASSSNTVSLTATKLPDVQFVNATGSSEFLPSATDTREIIIPVTLPSNVTLFDGATVEIALQERVTQGATLGEWTDITETLTKNTDGTYQFIYETDPITLDGSIELKLIEGDSNTIGTQVDYDHQISISAAVATQFSLTAGSTINSSTMYHNQDTVNIPFALTRALSNPVPMSFEVSHIKNHSTVHEERVSFTIPANVTVGNLEFTVPLVYGGATRMFVTADTPAFLGMTIEAAKNFALFNVESYQVQFIHSTDSDIVDPGEFTAIFLGTGFAVTEEFDVLYDIRFKNNGATSWSAWEEWTGRVLPSSISLNFTTVYTLPEFENTLDVEFKIKDQLGYDITNTNTYVFSATEKIINSSVVSFDTQDIADKRMSETVDIDITLGTDVTVFGAVITVPIKATYRPIGSTIITQTEEFDVPFAAGNTTGTLAFTAPRLHNHQVTLELDTDRTTNFLEHDSKTYSQFNVYANTISFPGTWTSGRHIPESTINFLAKTDLPSYGELVVSYRFRDSNATDADWEERTVTIEAGGDTENGFVIPHELPAFTSSYTLIVELLSSETGGVVVANPNNQLTSVIRPLSASVAFTTTTLSDKKIGETATFDILASRLLSTSEYSMPVKIEVKAVGAPDSAYTEYETISAIFPASAAIAYGYVSYTSPYLHNHDIRLTLAPTSESGIIVGSANTATYTAQGYNMHFEEENLNADGHIEVAKSPGGNIAVKMFTGDDVLVDVRVPIQRRIRDKDASWTAWQDFYVDVPAGNTATDGFTFYYTIPTFGDFAHIQFRFSNDATKGFVGTATGHAVGYKVNNLSPVITTERTITFDTQTFANRKIGQTVNVPLTLSQAYPFDVMVPLKKSYSYVGSSSLTAMTFTDETLYVRFQKDSTTATYTENADYLDDYRVEFTFQEATNLNLVVNIAKSYSRYTVRGYDLRFEDVAINTGHNPGDTVTIKMFTDTDAVTNVKVPLQRRIRTLTGSTWSSWGSGWQDFYVDVPAGDTATDGFTFDYTLPSFADELHMQVRIVREKSTGFYSTTGLPRTANYNVTKLSSQLGTDRTLTFDTQTLANRKIGQTVNIPLTLSQAYPFDITILLRKSYSYVGSSSLNPGVTPLPKTVYVTFAANSTTATYTEKADYLDDYRMNFTFQEVTNLNLVVNSAKTYSTYTITGYDLRFEDVAINTGHNPGDTATIKMFTDTDVTTNVKVPLQRRIRTLTGSTWSSWGSGWQDFYVDVPAGDTATDGFTFDYTLPSFANELHMQVRIVREKSTGFYAGNPAAPTANYNVTKLSTAIATARTLRFNTQSFTRKVNQSVSVPLTLSQAYPFDAVVSLRRSHTYVGTVSGVAGPPAKILYVTFAANSTTATYTEKAVYLPDHRVNFALHAGAPLNLNNHSTQSYSRYTVTSYGLRFETDRKTVVKNAGQTFAVKMFTDTDLLTNVVGTGALRYRTEIDGGNFSNWQDLSISGPGAGNTQTGGFTFNHTVPSSSTGGVVVEFDIKVPSASQTHAFHRIDGGHSRVRYDIIPTSAISTQRTARFSFSDRGDKSINAFIDLRMSLSQAFPFRVSVPVTKSYVYKGSVSGAVVPANKTVHVLFSANSITGYGYGTNSITGYGKERAENLHNYEVRYRLQSGSGLNLVNHSTDDSTKYRNYGYEVRFEHNGLGLRDSNNYTGPNIKFFTDRSIFKDINFTYRVRQRNSAYSNWGPWEYRTILITDNDDDFTILVPMNQSYMQVNIPEKPGQGFVNKPGRHHSQNYRRTN